MNNNKFVRNDNKLNCVICFECPKKIVKCNICYDTAICVNCYDEIEYMDELNICECCSEDRNNDTRLFLLRKCPICRSVGKRLINDKNLKNYSKKKIVKLLTEYNKKTIDRINRNIGVNRHNNILPPSYLSDSEDDDFYRETDTLTRRQRLMNQNPIDLYDSQYLIDLHLYRQVNNYYRIEITELWEQMRRMNLNPSF